MALLPRLRQRDDRQTVYVQYGEKYPSGGGSVMSVTNAYSQRSGTYQIVQDVWSKDYKPGRLMVNPVNMRKQVTVGSSVSLNIPSTGYGRPTISISGPVGLIPYNFPGTTNMSYDHILDPARTDAAIYRAYQKMNEPTAELGMFLSELSETLDMLWSPVASLRRMLHPKLRRQSWRNMKKMIQSSKRLANQVSDWWLTYRYGIRPLMSDISMLTALVDDPFHRPQWEVKRATQKVTVPPVTQDTSCRVGNVQIFFRDVVHTTKKTAVGLYVQPKNPNTVAYSAYDVGLDWRQLLSIGWNKIPFSFVVDWGIGVGDYLDSLHVNPSIVCIGSFKSDVVSTDTVRTTTSYRSYWGQSGPCISRSQFTERRLIRTTGIPIPASELKLKTNVFANTNRIADALSLAWQRAR